jgi:LysR family transcriptional regulator, cys regulon transcriptional activator
MNFQQLRIVRETVRCRFSLTEVASRLYVAQSGVSKHIRDLEDELGLELFVRRGKRLLGLTEPGKELVPLIERILVDTENIKHIGEKLTDQGQGQLTIATTHTQARYALPPVVTRFKHAFPKVHLELLQGTPKEIVTLVHAEEADIGIATEALGEADDLVTFPFYTWHHAVIVPQDHPLTQASPLTLEAIAEHPIITYHPGYTGRSRIDQAFSQAGLVPDVVMSALDADVIKAYVEGGLGVGIIAAVAYHRMRDSALRLLETPSLFERNTVLLALRRGRYLRDYALHFILECAPELTLEQIKAAVFPRSS